uniref:Uncharacterized protein n=1 Tax=Ciona savignyi TaxID=51511 RepID=H2Z9C1_CIOSA
MEHNEQQIDSNFQNLLDTLNSGNFVSGSDASQSQQQVQSQIQKLDSQVQQQSQLQQQFQSSVKHDLTKVSDLLDSADQSIQLPKGLETKEHHIVDQLSAQKTKDVKAEEDIHSQIKNAIQELTNTDIEGDASLQQLVHKTISDLNQLDSNQNHLLNQEQQQLQNLLAMDTTDLGQFQSEKRSDDLAEEIENLIN